MMNIALLAALALLFASPTLAAGAGQAPSGLMCDLLAMPARTLIQDPAPKLSWIVNSQVNDDMQTAYQIRVAETPVVLDRADGGTWDSGKVASDQSVAVAYGGTSLLPGHAYFWKVRVWNRASQASAWSAPQEFHTGAFPGSAVGDTERHTVARYPLVQTEIAPALVTELWPGHYFLDFGRDAFAALNLTFPRAADGQIVTVHLGEATDSPGHVNRQPGGSVRYHEAALTLKSGQAEYIVPLGPKDGRMMPPEIGPVMPFRYVEIENAPVPLDKTMARQIAAHYALDDDAASFVSSDQTLNAVWDLCSYTINATTFCGIYVDGDRERKPYEADTLIQQLGDYNVNREFTLARYSHEYLIQHPTWPTEWILQSVLIAWTDYLYTGDSASLAEFYPDLKAKTLPGLARADGLISTTQPPVSKAILESVHSTSMRDIVDWPPAERDGYDMRPVNTVVNAFHYRSLVLLAQIADALHKPQDAMGYRSAAAQAAQSFNTAFYNTATGLYVDGEGSAHSSLHANMFALAFGLVPPERLPKVAAFVGSKGMACSVYGAQFLLEALYETGQADQALALLTARGARGWAHMTDDVGSTLTTEAWDSKDKPNQDWNHAWGAAPANIIPRLLMGVEPLEPGFRKIRIRPQPGSLQSASLKLPTIRGDVHVEFQNTPAQFALHVDLPANTTTEVWLPRFRLDSQQITVDGVRREGRAEGQFIVIAPVGSGAHTFLRTKR